MEGRSRPGYRDSLNLFVDAKCHEPIAADSIVNFAVAITTCRRGRACTRDSRNNLHLVAHRKHAARNHRILLAQFDLNRPGAECETFHSKWRARFSGVASKHEERAC